MKIREFLFALLIFFSSFFAFAEKVNFISSEKSLSLVSGFSFQSNSDFEYSSSASDLSLDLNMTELFASAGCKFQSNQTDFSTEIVYCPTFFDCFNAGAGHIFHVLHYNDLFNEYDFLTGLYLGYHSPKHFDCKLNLMWHAKAVEIFVIKDEVPWIKNSSFACKTEFNFRPVENLKLSLSLSSYSPYRYMLFFAPDLMFSCEYTFGQLISIGNQVEIQYIDMFTLSSNFNSIDYRLYARLAIK